MIPNDVPISPYGSADPVLDLARLTRSAEVTVTEAAAAVQASFGLGGALDRLPGEADDNFDLLSTAGRRYVVKFAHLRADPEVVSVQVRVLRHIESAAAGLPVPRVVPAVDGRPWVVVADGPLRGRVVHVLPTWTAGCSGRCRPRRPCGAGWARPWPRSGRPCAPLTTRSCTRRCCGTWRSCPSSARYWPSCRPARVPAGSASSSAGSPPR